MVLKVLNVLKGKQEQEFHHLNKFEIQLFSNVLVRNISVYVPMEEEESDLLCIDARIVRCNTSVHTLTSTTAV